MLETQKYYDQTVDTYPFVSDILPGWYDTQEMRDKEFPRKRLC